MANVLFELDDAIATQLAKVLGWEGEYIDDIESDMIDGDYVKKPNPITLDIFLAQALPKYAQEQVLKLVRQSIIDRYRSKAKQIELSLADEQFTQLILAGDFDQIDQIIKSNL